MYTLGRGKAVPTAVVRELSLVAREPKQIRMLREKLSAWPVMIFLERQVDGKVETSNWQLVQSPQG